MNEIDIALAIASGEDFAIKENWSTQTYTITRRVWVKQWKRPWYYIAGLCPYTEITYTGVKLKRMWADVDGTFHAELYVPAQCGAVDIDFVL